MSDYTELKRLAESIHGKGSTIDMLNRWAAFESACKPDLILAMIAENERLESEAVYSAAGFDAAREEIARLKAEIEIFEEGMRSLASTLGAGGYNAETLTATQLIEKVQWGVDHLADMSGRLVDQLRTEVAGLRTGYEAYEQVNAELKAEVELLESSRAKLAGELSRLRAKHKDWSVIAAMGKGVRGGQSTLKTSESADLEGSKGGGQ